MRLSRGVTIGLNPGCTNQAGNYAYWNKLIPDMYLLGLTRLRFQYSWCSIEYPQGVYNWGPLDDAVTQTNNAGIQLVFPLRVAPTWALTNVNQQATTEPFFLPDPTLFAGFAQALVNRYGNSIYGFEVGNEDFNIKFTSPTGGYSGIHSAYYPGLYGNGGAVTSSNKWQPGRDPYFYEPVAAAAYPILKSHGAVVGMGAMWWPQPANPGGVPDTPVSNYYAYLDTLFHDGFMQYADYINLHWYTNNTIPYLGNKQVITLTQALSDITTVLNNYNSKLTVRITEFGWAVPSDAPDYSTQGYWYAYALNNMLTSPIVSGFDFYTLDYTIGGSPASLVTASAGPTYTYRPAFYEVQNLSSC